MNAMQPGRCSDMESALGKPLSKRPWSKYLFRRHHSFDQLKDSPSLRMSMRSDNYVDRTRSPPEVKKALSIESAPRHIDRFKDTSPLTKCYSADEGLVCNSVDMNDEIIYEEKGKEIVEGVDVRAATIDRIVHIIIQSFSDRSESPAPWSEKAPFLRIFFLMHKWVLDSQLLANHLYTRLESEPHGVDALRICAALRYWMHAFPDHFDLDKTLTSMIEQLIKKLSEWGREDLQALLDISDVPSFDWMRVTSSRKNTSMSNRIIIQESLVFNKLEADQLATQLTVLEFKAFRRITFADLKKYSTSGYLKDSPRLEKSISLFNGLCQWIQCLILNKTTPAERATVIARFVEVARQLYKQNNFNTLMAVIGGLTHSSIARLTKTNACLSQETQKSLADFTELLSASNNFSNYRREVFQAVGFKIPILGIHLKDLILLHTALPDYIKNALVNVRKLCQLSHTFAFISDCQLCGLPFNENIELCNTLRLSLDYHYTEEEIFELSLAREPRNSVSPSTPTKPVVFADWIAGLKPPDPETLKKHVNDMVEAVFKVYDHNKDGSISQDEFNQISENFPFIDSFAVLDTDNDGIISRREMKTYFMRANCNALRNSFKHDFHETTYFKLTFCAHCTGLLWGLIKQGWKCRLCAINAHKHCKDLVVAECRSNRHHTPRTGSLSEYSSTLSMNSVTPYSSILTENDSQRRTNLDETRKFQVNMKQSFYLNSTTQTEDVNEVSENNLTELTNDKEVDEMQSYESCWKLGNEQSVTLPPLFDVSEVDENDRLSGQKTMETVMKKIIEERDYILEENQTLRDRLDKQATQINAMRNYIIAVRQHTISFILTQMDTLNLQRDSEV